VSSTAPNLASHSPLCRRVEPQADVSRGPRAIGTSRRAPRGVSSSCARSRRRPCSNPWPSVGCSIRSLDGVQSDRRPRLSWKSEFRLPGQSQVAIPEDVVDTTYQTFLIAVRFSIGRQLPGPAQSTIRRVNAPATIPSRNALKNARKRNVLTAPSELYSEFVSHPTSGLQHSLRAISG
jgi:hypothetical protein